MATSKFLRNKHILALFAITNMTLLSWRKGQKNREALPHQIDESGRPAYKPAEVKKWAKQNGVEFDAALLEKLISESSASDAKRGPKVGKPPVAAKKAKAGAQRREVATVKKAKPPVKPSVIPKTKPVAEARAS